MSRFFDIIARQSENVEVELRYKNNNKDLIFAVYDRLLQATPPIKSSIEFAINVIKPSASPRPGFAGRAGHADMRENYIRSKTFCGKDTNDKYYIKRNVAREDIGMFKLNAALEIPTAKFDITSEMLTRIKVRVSWFIDDWRLDLTFAQQDKFSAFNMANIKQKLFRCEMNATQLYKVLAAYQFSAYEIECEFMPMHAKIPTRESVDAIIKKLNTYLKDNASEIMHIAKLLDVRGYAGTLGNFSSVRNKAMSLTKTSYMDIFPPIDWYVTEKSDGVRCFILMEDSRMVIITDTVVEHTLSAPVPFRMLCDAEFISGVAHIFDCMIYDKYVFNSGFSTRLEYLQKCAEMINSARTAGDAVAAAQPIRAVAKHFEKITEENLKDVFIKVHDAKRDHAIDGLIIVSPNDAYRKTKNYKWKLHEHNTIDFLAFKYPGPAQGVMSARPKHDLYILMVGINHEKRLRMNLKLIQFYDVMVKTKFDNLSPEYYPVQFSPSINPRAYIYHHPQEAGDINGKVVEMRCDECRSMVSRWKLVKVREDRKMERVDFGNDYKIAELTYNNYLDPLTLEELSDPRSGYFEKVADNIYRDSNGYKRMVITKVLEKYFNGADYVIDEASGRGADLMRYYALNIKNLLCMDIDKAAITELIVRKNSGLDKKDAKINTRVSALIEDLRTPYKTMIANFNYYGFSEGTVDGIVCNFAIHYMCKTQADIQNVMRLNSEMLKVGGYYAFTTMNGAKIFDLLSGYVVGDRWEVNQGEQLKYAIRRDYKSDELANVGQMISVLLPMSNGKLYEEPLANIDYIIAVAAQHGLELVEEFSFGRFFNDWEGTPLSNDDKHYIGLHHVVVLKKVEQGKKVGGYRSSRPRRVAK